MGRSRLHARCRNVPEAFLKIDFRPSGAKDLPGPRSSQDEKLQGETSLALNPTKGLEKIRELTIGQRRVRFLDMQAGGPWH